MGNWRKKSPKLDLIAHKQVSNVGSCEPLVDIFVQTKYIYYPLYPK